MNTNPHHQPETENHGELQEFSGPALSPDDPGLEPREHKGRPKNPLKLESTDKDTGDEQKIPPE